MRRSTRGFSLIELTLVIFIMMLALVAFATVMGSRSVGPAIERNAAQLKSMTAGIRQNCSVRKVHGELVLDYKNDLAVALTRERLAGFAFEDSPGTNAVLGSKGLLGRLSGEATTMASRQFLLLDGKALDLSAPNARFTLPWSETFDTSGDYEGMALRFDFFPMQFDAAGRHVRQQSTFVKMGTLFDLKVEHIGPYGVRLQLTGAGKTVLAMTQTAYYRWVTVEIAVSRYGVRLFVEGRPSEAADVDPVIMDIPNVQGSSVDIGGVPCRIDNFELYRLVGSSEIELEGCRLVHVGVDPQLELDGEAEGIFGKAPPKAGGQGQGASGPVTGPGGSTQTPPTPKQGLPEQPMPSLVHIYYDEAGKLDRSKHAGAHFVYMIMDDGGGEPRRMVLTFHPLGTVTDEEVDRFPWEPEPKGVGK